jgi:hypothetical protein
LAKFEEKFMRSMRKLFAGAGAVCVTMLMVSAAWAGHGKVGLWQVTIKMDMAGMPQIPPEQMAKMKAMGIKLPMNDTFTTEHCMTAEEVAMSKPPEMPNHGKQECKIQNMKTDGQSVSADMICTGKANGGGHFKFTYDTPEHYSGKVSTNVMIHGHAMASTASFEGRWISARCKTAAH